MNKWAEKISRSKLFILFFPGGEIERRWEKDRKFCEEQDARSKRRYEKHQKEHLEFMRQRAIWNQGPGAVIKSRPKNCYE